MGVDNGVQSWTIVAVDGQDFKFTFSQVFELEPGHHRLAISFADGVWVRTQSLEPCDVNFVAEAGHRYTVEAGSSKSGWWAYLLDRNTGQKVPCDQRRRVYFE